MTKRFVLFDVGETLLGPRPSYAHHFVDECSRAGIGLERAEAETAIRAELARHVERVRHSRAGRFSTSTEQSRVFWFEFYRDVLVELGESEFPDELPDLLYARFSSFDTYDWIDDAEAGFFGVLDSGHRVGVLSNWEAWLPELLDHIGIREHLEACVVSGIVGVEKPDPEIFEIALAQAGTDPETTVMVGDSIEADIEPALSLGMTAILFDRHDRHSESAFRRVRSLAELPALLGCDSGAIRADQ